MQTKIIILLFIIAGIYSCKKDKRDILFPPKDYRDSVVGSYSGIKIYNTWLINVYSTSDTSSCTIQIIKDNSNKNKININGTSAFYYENDSMIYRSGPGNGGFFTPSASNFRMYFSFSGGGMGQGNSTNYQVIKD